MVETGPRLTRGARGDARPPGTDLADSGTGDWRKSLLEGNARNGKRRGARAVQNLADHRMRIVRPRVLGFGVAVCTLRVAGTLAFQRFGATESPLVCVVEFLRVAHVG